ncbi:hypothetical protein MMC16_005408 [Acarospora aff. strigata]|nr:hypothetical protein [Acarospora aff. strigata]
MRPLPHTKRRWPPPPSVEDEMVALAKEANSSKKTNSTDIGDGEALVRGSIDQQPIILEVLPPASKSSTQPQGAQKKTDHTLNDWSSIRTKSSSESLGPQTPVDTVEFNHDRRYVYIPQKGVEMPALYGQTHKSPRSDNPPQGDLDRFQRGRGNVTQLKTPDLDGSIDGVTVDSSRRHPSPYAYTASSNKNRYSANYLLSPESVRGEVALVSKDGMNSIVNLVLKGPNSLDHIMHGLQLSDTTLLCLFLDLVYDFNNQGLNPAPSTRPTSLIPKPVIPQDSMAGSGLRVVALRNPLDPLSL